MINEHWRWFELFHGIEFRFLKCVWKNGRAGYACIVDGVEASEKWVKFHSMQIHYAVMIFFLRFVVYLIHHPYLQGIPSKWASFVTNEIVMFHSYHWEMNGIWDLDSLLGGGEQKGGTDTKYTTPSTLPPTLHRYHRHGPDYMFPLWLT